MFAFRPCGDTSLQRLNISRKNNLYKMKTAAAWPSGQGSGLEIFQLGFFERVYVKFLLAYRFCIAEFELF